MKPPAPDWWPVADTWWLPGGIWTGVTQVASAVIAVGLIIYSYRRFHGHPEKADELRSDIKARGRKAEDRTVGADN